MIDKFNDYEFEVFEYPDDDYPSTKYYYYRIYKDKYFKNYIESDGNMFDTEQEARFAAIGHISLLENGEDNVYARPR
jgi:hypothetical protein